MARLECLLVRAIDLLLLMLVNHSIVIRMRVLFGDLRLAFDVIVNFESVPVGIRSQSRLLMIGIL